MLPPSSPQTEAPLPNSPTSHAHEDNNNNDNNPTQSQMNKYYSNTCGRCHQKKHYKEQSTTRFFFERGVWTCAVCYWREEKQVWKEEFATSSSCSQQVVSTHSTANTTTTTRIATSHNTARINQHHQPVTNSSINAVPSNQAKQSVNKAVLSTNAKPNQPTTASFAAKSILRGSQGQLMKIQVPKKQNKVQQAPKLAASKQKPKDQDLQDFLVSSSEEEEEQEEDTSESEHSEEERPRKKRKYY